MASLKEVEKLADDLENLVGELRSEIRNNTDFEKLMQIADEISEHADNVAQTFGSVNEALMSRLEDVKGVAKRAGAGSKASSSS